MTTALGIAAVLALILANGYFVAAEFAFVAVRRGRLEELAAAGDARASRAVDVTRRLSFVLSGAQLGITVTSLVVGYIAEPTLGRALQPLVELAGLPPASARGVAFSIAFALATATQMVVGELAPKNLAIAEPEPVALSLARSTWWYTRIAGPLIRLFDSSSNRLLRAVGIEPVEELSGGVSAEELELIISESGREGTLTSAQTRLLSRALEFRELRAEDVLVPRRDVVAIRADATGADLRELALDSGRSRFPVIGDSLDDVRGVVQAKDLFRVPPAARAAVPVADLLQPALAVPESARLGRLLTEMREARTPLAVVVDEYGGTAGIVTLEDVVEELVGEIADEHDVDEPRVVAHADGSLGVPGSWRIDEVARDTGVALPEGDYDTVSGLVMAELGRLPEVGDTVELATARLVVESMNGLAVGTVRLTPLADGGEAGDHEDGAPGDDSEADR